MNNSQFTSEQIRKALPVLVKNRRGITTSESYGNKHLVEFSVNSPIVLEQVDEKDELITIEFYQELSECECCGSFKYEYVTVQDVNDIINAI